MHLLSAPIANMAIWMRENGNVGCTFHVCLSLIKRYAQEGVKQNTENKEARRITSAQASLGQYLVFFSAKLQKGRYMRWRAKRIA